MSRACKEASFLWMFILAKQVQTSSVRGREKFFILLAVVSVAANRKKVFALFFEFLILLL